VFQLAEDDSAVTVSLAGDGEETAPDEAAKRLVGRYVRQSEAQGYYKLKSDAFDGSLTVERAGGENSYAVHLFAVQKGGANNMGEVDGIGVLVGNKIKISPGYGDGIPGLVDAVEVIFAGETARVATSEAFKGGGWLGAGVVLDGEYEREEATK
ncbi:MAG: hypothetical protein LBU64_02075, partial [Planctomycetota bacterium]|nr:hypothetical protein [Planctomycetota bacterium]